MSYKKKILLVIHAWQVGGVKTSTTNVANALHKKGYDVTILVTSNRCERSDDLLPDIRLITKEEKQNKILSRLPFFRNFWQSGMWSTRQTPKKLNKYFVGDEKYDVEIAIFFGRPLKVVYGSTNSSSKKVMWIKSDFSYGDAKGYLSCFEKKEQAIDAYNSLDATICVSQGVKQSFEKEIGRTNNNFVVYNLNNNNKIRSLALEEIPVKRQRFTFVFVGRLSEEKGLMRFLSNIKKLNEDGFEFDVWVIGDGPEMTLAQQYVAENNLTNVILFGKKVNPYPYMQNADMLVLPSKAEAYGLSLAEALILKKPVIATECVGPKDILDGGKYGILVKNDDNGLYQGLKNVLQDKSLVEHYKQKAVERAEFFEEDAIITQIEKIIN